MGKLKYKIKVFILKYLYKYFLSNAKNKIMDNFYSLAVIIYKKDVACAVIFKLKIYTDMYNIRVNRKNLFKNEMYVTVNTTTGMRQISNEIKDFIYKNFNKYSLLNIYQYQNKLLNGSILE